MQARDDVSVITVIAVSSLAVHALMPFRFAPGPYGTVMSGHIRGEEIYSAAS